mgnify:CR=1 FL=1
MRYLITLIITMIYAVTATAQAIERPKIGLVLSGGGAKGLAHVGVLKAIDEAGLTIDYISGTSMGAIIAAMYAAGYSGEEIEEASRNIDWTSLMSGSVDFLDISIEEKENYENYSINVPLKGFKMSPFTGVKEPQEVMLKFAEVFFPVYKTKKFDQLDIPFRCIAADLSNGDAVVIKEGDLAFAVRSSMAIPGVFEATNYGETKLVDGGIVRNFPVRDVKDMGADFVIGVNLFPGLYEPHDLTTAVDVLMQIANFRDANDLIDEKRQCDMVIEPDVTGFSAASFGSSDKILAIGDSVGKDFYPLFKQLADSFHNHYGLEYSTKERLPQYSDSVVIKSFDIVGLSNTTQGLLMHNLNLKIGESYTVQQLNDAFRKAYSSQYYTNLTYELIPIDDENGVSLKCNVEEYPLSSLKIGLSYNSFTDASFIFGYSHKNLTGERSISDIKVAISESFHLRLKNRIYFGSKYNHYFDAYYDYSMYELPIYEKEKKLYIYDYRHNDFALQVGHIFNKQNEAIIKVGYESFNIKPDVDGVVDTCNMKINGRINNFYINLKHQYNSLNRKYLPQKGINANSDLYIALKPKYKITNPCIFRLSAEISMYQAISERATLIENASLVTSYGFQTVAHKTALGGVNTFLPSHKAFYGLPTAHSLEESFISMRLGYQYRLVDELYAIFHYNMAKPFYNIEQYIDDEIMYTPDQKEYIPEKNDKGEYIEPIRDDIIKYGGKSFKETMKENNYLFGLGLTLAYNFSYLPFDLTLMYSPDYTFSVSVNVGFLF